ncbi:MAG: hypothetical protein AAF694_12205 [Bacteroidota bacterium]
MKPKNFILIVCLLAFASFNCYAQEGHWPPNEGRGSSAGTFNMQFNSVIPGQGEDLKRERDSFPIQFFPVQSLDQVRKAKTAINFRIGANIEAGEGDQNLGETFGNNLFLNISFSRRPQAILDVREYAESLPFDVELPPGEFVFIQQTPIYYEPELTLSFMEFDRLGSTFRPTYLDLIPVAFKANLSNNISVGAGAGVNFLLGIQQDGQSIDNLSDNGFEPAGLVGMFNASIYFSSPFHLDLKYVFRTAEYDEQRFLLGNFLIAFGYSLGNSNPVSQATPALEINQPNRN